MQGNAPLSLGGKLFLQLAQDGESVPLPAVVRPHAEIGQEHFARLGVGIPHIAHVLAVFVLHLQERVAGGVHALGQQFLKLLGGGTQGVLFRLRAGGYQRSGIAADAPFLESVIFLQSKGSKSDHHFAPSLNPCPVKGGDVAFIRRLHVLHKTVL